MDVTIGGLTTLATIDPTSAGQIPTAFLPVSNGGAFDISTNAMVAAPITVCAAVPSVVDQAAFSDLRLLHGEGGVLVDRTILAPSSPAPNFATRTVCGRVGSLSPFVVVQLAPQGSLQSVLAELVALRQGTSDKQDARRLDDAIARLSAALAPALFANPSHLHPARGEQFFDETKRAVKELGDLLKNKKSAIPDAVLQNFINRILRASRLLAQIATDEATAANGKPAGIARANNELSKGDAEAAQGKTTQALEHYGEAWRGALRAAGANIDD